MDHLLQQIFSHLAQRRLDPGKETLGEFFQVRNEKEYQNVVIISFVNLEKINTFCFMHKGVVQKLSLPRPLENRLKMAINQPILKLKTSPSRFK